MMNDSSISRLTRRFLCTLLVIKDIYKPVVMVYNDLTALWIFTSAQKPTFQNSPNLRISTPVPIYSFPADLRCFLTIISLDNMYVVAAHGAAYLDSTLRIGRSLQGFYPAGTVSLVDSTG